MSYESMLDIVGDTPLVQVGKEPKLLAKMELLNPSHSMKARLGRQATEAAIEEGCEYVVAPSTGNTGIAVSMASAAEDVEAIITVPTDPNEFKTNIMEAYGSKVYAAPRSTTYKEFARDVASSDNAYLYDQYNGEHDNPHSTTGEEIYESVDDLTHFVAAIGSGGTITGISKALPEEIEVIGVDNVKSNLTEIFKGEDYSPTVSDIEGVGRHYQSAALDFEYVNDVQEVSREECVEGSRELAREHGILCGLSSGAVYEVMNRIETDGTVVGMFADSGNRYLEDLA